MENAGNENNASVQKFDLEIPEIQVAPSSYNISARPGQIKNRSMIVHNVGNYPLNWRAYSIDEANAGRIRKVASFPDALIAPVRIASEEEYLWILDDFDLTVNKVNPEDC